MAWELFQQQIDKLPGLQEEERKALWRSKLRICYEFLTPQGCNRGEQCEYEHKKLSAVLAQLGYRRQRDQLASDQTGY